MRFKSCDGANTPWQRAALTAVWLAASLTVAIAAGIQPAICRAAETSPADPAIGGLVGRWDFDDGTGKDFSGNGHDAVVDAAQIHQLGPGHACLRLMPDGPPVRMPAAADSQLAISRGTVSVWLNVAWTQMANVLSYDNDAIQINVYRGHLQPRFRGEGKFKYSSGVIDDDWRKHDLREWAFYPHSKAVVGESEWHHFVVAYDNQLKRITGWRDGEQIALIDLSTTKMEPLRTRGLKGISLSQDFAGYLDDIRVYNRPLSDDEARQIFDATQSIYSGRADTMSNGRKMEVYRPREEDRVLNRAWLQYRAPSQKRGEQSLKTIVAEGDNSTVRTATAELSAATKSMFEFEPAIVGKDASGARVVLGTPTTSSWIRDRAAELGLDRVKDDGFVIKTLREKDAAVLVVAAKVPAGVIFGTFDLIRRIGGGQDPEQLDVLENPKIPLRMVDHWSNFRGAGNDDWRGRKPGSKGNVSRDNSIFSWEDLRTGDAQLIRDWVRLISSSGWNALSPSEINWDERNNFLEHLNEVAKLADICRDYGVKLYWSPSYLLALDKSTADRLYERVPDFGGYLMKLGSEKQNGDPRPAMVNRIADTLKPHGGFVLVRGFVYGNGRYDAEPYRNLIPYDVFAREDGNYHDNVIIVPKGSPLDWDFSAPIPALDGAIQKNLSGSELVIDKNWPASWVEKWKWWLEQDNYRRGPGSLNKNDVDCIMGVSMIQPAPAWATSPLNMLNYYGLGRLAWNPDLTTDEIYAEWIGQTFGNDPEIVDTVGQIASISDDVVRKLYLYRGYRGVWLDTGDAESMVKAKSTHIASREGIGTSSGTLQKMALDQYAPALRAIFRDPVLGEEFLSSFHFAKYDQRLTSGRTVAQDFCANLDEAVELAEQMVQLWDRLKGKIDDRQFASTRESLQQFVETANKSREKVIEAFENASGRKAKDVLATLSALKLAEVRVFNVRDFGAKPDAAANNAPAINAAIDACAAAGGGTVFVPTGLFGCGTIHLKSNVSLALDAGAVLKALPTEMDAWEENPNDQGLMDAAYYHWRASLVCGEDLQNVKIFGPGTLDGTALTRSSKVKRGTGDKAIALKRCGGVEIVNLNIKEGGHYAILASGCDDVRIDNVTIKTSRDGLNLAQCRNVNVANSHIVAVRYEDGKPAGGDDAIKLGSDLSLGEARWSENITVRNCFLASGCNALQFGTETVGAFREIRFEDIRIATAGKAGIGITSNDGSVIEDVRFKNITMEKTFVPFFIKVSDVARVPQGTYKRGAIRNVSFENIQCTDGWSPTRKGEMASVIWGKPSGAIEDIEFNNVQITVKGGHPAAEASASPSENDERFPQDVGGLPAYAWYIRNAKGVRMIDCRFEYESEDGRPALVFDNAVEVAIEGSTIESSPSSGRPVATRNGSDVNITSGKRVAGRRVATSGGDLKSGEVERPPTSAAPTVQSTADGAPQSAAPAPAELGTTYEAEQASVEGAELKSKRDGFTGTGYVDFSRPGGDFIEWTVRVEKDGKYRLAFRYAEKKQGKPLELKVNGQVANAALVFPSTRGWETWDVSSAVANLRKGTNTIRLSTTGESGGNVDSLRVEPVASE